MRFIKQLLFIIFSINTTLLGVTLNWTDNSDNETGFSIERKLDLSLNGSIVAIKDANVRNSPLIDPSTFIVKKPIGTAGVIIDGPYEGINTLNEVLIWWKVKWNDDGVEGWVGADNIDMNNSFSLLQTVGQDITTFVDNNVEPSSTYSYRVLAFNDVGNSEYTNVASITLAAPVQDFPPEKIAEINLTSPFFESFDTKFIIVDGESITLSWPQVTNTDYYELQVVWLDKNFEYPILNVGNQTHATINRYRAGHFSIKVRAVNENGASEWLDSKTFGWIIYWKLPLPGPIIIE